MAPESRRIDLAPDCAKAFGIALVVFGHALRGLFSSGIMEREGLWLTVDSLIYLFHMPLFFYLSGLFITQSASHHDYKNFLKKTANALLPPMVFWSYLQFSLQYSAGSYANTSIGLIDVLTAPFPPRQQFWFIGALFTMMVVTGFMIKTVRFRNYLWPLIAVLLLINALFEEKTMAQIHQNHFLVLIASSIFFWPYFLLGSAIGTETIRRLRIGNTVCLGIFAAALSAYFVIDAVPSAVRVFACLLCIFSVYKIALNAEERYGARRWMKILAFIGMNSMIIYLAHVIFSAGFRTFLVKMGMTNPDIHLFGGFIAGFAGPLVLIPVGLFLQKKYPAISAAIVPVRAQRA